VKAKKQELEAQNKDAKEAKVFGENAGELILMGPYHGRKREDWRCTVLGTTSTVSSHATYSASAVNRYCEASIKQ
jgi:hypothetical protein